MGVGVVVVVVCWAIVAADGGNGGRGKTEERLGPGR